MKKVIVRKRATEYYIAAVVAEVPDDATEKEIEALFSEYGDWYWERSDKWEEDEGVDISPSEDEAVMTVRRKDGQLKDVTEYIWQPSPNPDSRLGGKWVRKEEQE
jgi:hypothetical protein